MIGTDLVWNLVYRKEVLGGVFVDVLCHRGRVRNRNYVNAMRAYPIDLSAYSWWANVQWDIERDWVDFEALEVILLYQTCQALLE